MPCKDLAIKCADFLCQTGELAGQTQQSRSGDLCDAAIAVLFELLDQPENILRPLWRNDPQLSHMRAQCIYQHCALPYEKVTDPVQHHGRLLIDTFYGHKVHIRARNSLANSLRISRIILLPLNVGFYI
ncbi:unnamed protein product, partial [Ectocarpus sp. 12 AP-2014]